MHLDYTVAETTETAATTETVETTEIVKTSNHRVNRANREIRALF